MPQFQLKEVTLRYSAAALLDGVNLQVEEGERVCLLGRNGTGKTSLMRVIAGEETPNSGEVVRPQSSVFTRLTQEIPDNISGTVMKVIESGLSPDRHEEEWETHMRLDALVEEMSLPSSADFNSLSGGLKRRVLLARALAGRPDVLLLDEPTNHLDIDSILWLEQFLLEHKPTLFFVTHDRAFLRKLSTRIVELDRGQLSNWACDYDTYLVRKAAALEAEEKQRALFDKKLAQEEAWLRQGVKARRTRNEGRVRALEKMRSERKLRREREGSARIEIQESGMSGQKVVEAKDITFSYDTKLVVKNFSTTIWRGDKIGLIGPNGSGKTTLIRLLLGQINPDSGSIKPGTNLQIVYLDQLRGAIDESKTVAQNVAGQAESVTFQGRSRHVLSYLQDFLFSPDRARMPAKVLSGGERNRVMLARLFLQPANVLVLDEPTNDLDAETLELLEDLLVEYSGTLLLVSHDRVFLDNVVTSTLVHEGDGIFSEYNGGYADWLKTKKSKPVLPENIVKTSVAVENIKPAAKTGKPRKFLNREKRELSEMPALIEELEAEQTCIAAKLWEPDLYKNEPLLVQQLKDRQLELQERITRGYARWEELEAIQAECEPKS